MIILVERLRDKMELLKLAVPKDPTVTILKNVCITRGKLAATDLEVKLILNLPEAKDESYLLPYIQVLSLLKTLPGRKILTIAPHTKGIQLSWKGGSSVFPTAKVIDYPDIAQQPEIIAGSDVNGDKLIPALIEAMPYCAIKEDRPVLCGVDLYMDNVIQVAASDAFRATFKSLNMGYPLKTVLIIPTHTIKLLELLWKKAPGNPSQGTSPISSLTSAGLINTMVGERKIKLSVYKDSAGFKLQWGEIILVSQTISGTPPDILRLLGTFKEPHKARFMAPELWFAVKKVAKLAKDTNSIVKLQWTASQMSVTAGNDDNGEISSSFALEAGSEPGRIAVNCNYLTDYMSDKEGIVTMGFNERTNPLIFHYNDSPVVSIMPMFVKWDDEIVAEDKKDEKAAEDKKDPVVPGTGGLTEAEILHGDYEPGVEDGDGMPNQEREEEPGEDGTPDNGELEGTEEEEEDVEARDELDGQQDDSDDPTSVLYKTDQPENLVAEMDKITVAPTQTEEGIPDATTTPSKRGGRRKKTE